MEFQQRSISDEISRRSSLQVAILVLSFLLLLSKCVAGVTDQELQSLTGALRSKGYNLFGNAIATSDLQYQILAGDSFTLFCPIDLALYSLDMASHASDYVQTLRYHLVPRRLSISDLRNPSLGSYLDTLLPNHFVMIGSSQIKPTKALPSDVTVDGVRISAPDLFLGPSVAVHGLDGILSARFLAATNSPPADWPQERISPLSSPIVSHNDSEGSPLSENVPVQTSVHSNSKKHKKHLSHRKTTTPNVHAHRHDGAVKITEETETEEL